MKEKRKLANDDSSGYLLTLTVCVLNFMVLKPLTGLKLLFSEVLKMYLYKCLHAPTFCAVK